MEIKTTYPDVMIDLETLGSNSNSVIVSIGAVPFNVETGEYSREHSFFVHIDIQDSLNQGLTVEGDTIVWWMQQTKEARETNFYPSKATIFTLRNALAKLIGWFQYHTERGVRVWGNGARFDLGLLQNSFAKVGFKVPWLYKDERDVRTLITFKPELKYYAEDLHNPIEDAIVQIDYTSKIYQMILEGFENTFKYKSLSK